MFGRRTLAAIIAEFLGTATLVFVVVNVSRSAVGIPYFVAFAAGLAVIFMGLSVATDVQLNPALTLALWTARRIKTSRAVVYIAVQLLGGWAAYALYKYLAHSTTQPVTGKFESHILIAEAVGTFVFALAAAKVFFNQIEGWSRALLVGGSYALGMIVASAAANGLINPAVALGTSSWVWGTYVLGPVIGAVIGVNLYGLLFYQPEKEVAKSRAKK